MRMYLRAACAICGKLAIFDVSTSLEEFRKKLGKVQFGQCPAGGFHVEIGSMADYFAIDWKRGYETPEDARQNKNPIFPEDLLAVGSGWNTCECEEDPKGRPVCVKTNGRCRFKKSGSNYCLYRTMYPNKRFKRPLINCLDAE